MTARLSVVLVSLGSAAAIAAAIGGLISYGPATLTGRDIRGLVVGLVLALAPALLVWNGIRRSRSVAALLVPGWFPLSVAALALLNALFGIALTGAFSRYGPVLFLAGLAQLGGGLLMVRLTTKPWTAAAALIPAPIIAYACFMGAYVVSGNVLPPTRWEIPDGYRGYVMTAYGISSCAPLPKDFLTSVVVVDAKGHACTSDVLPNGYIEMGNEYMYVRDGVQIRIPRTFGEPASGDLTVSVWGRVDSSGQCPRSQQFFVGTLDDRRAAPTLFDRTQGIGCDLKPLRP